MEIINFPAYRRQVWEDHYSSWDVHTLSIELRYVKEFIVEYSDPERPYPSEVERLQQKQDFLEELIASKK